MNAPTGVFFVPYFLLFILNLAIIYALWPISSFNLFQICVLVLVSILINVLLIHTLRTKQKTLGLDSLVLGINRRWHIVGRNQNEADIQILKFWYGYFWLTLKIKNMQQDRVDYITIWKLSNDYANWKQLIVSLEWEFTIGQTSNKGNDI